MSAVWIPNQSSEAGRTSVIKGERTMNVLQKKCHHMQCYNVLQKLTFMETDTIFQQSFRVFSLLPEVFNAAANNLVTIRQGPDTSHMAGLAEVSAVSLPAAHYAVMEAGSLCFP